MTTLAEAMQMLLAVYPNSKATAETISLYMDALSDLNEETVVGAIREIGRSSKFFPSISEIREAAFDRAAWLADANPTSPWKIVADQMAKRIPGDGQGPWDLPPLVSEVVKAIGTHNLRTRSDAEDLFRKKYEEMRGSLIRDFMRGRITFRELCAITGADPDKQVFPSLSS